MNYIQFCTTVDILGYFYVQKETNPLRYRAIIFIAASKKSIYDSLLEYFDNDIDIVIIKHEKRRHITISNINSVLSLLNHIGNNSIYSTANISLLSKFVKSRLINNKKRYDLNDEIYYKTLKLTRYDK